MTQRHHCGPRGPLPHLPSAVQSHTVQHVSYNTWRLTLDRSHRQQLQPLSRTKGQEAEAD